MGSLPYLLHPSQTGGHMWTLKALSQQLICHAYLHQPSLNLAVGQLSTLQMCCTLLGLLALPPIPQPLCKQNNNKQNLGLLALPPLSEPSGWPRVDPESAVHFPNSSFAMPIPASTFLHLAAGHLPTLQMCFSFLGLLVLALPPIPALSL